MALRLAFRADSNGNGKQMRLWPFPRRGGATAALADEQPLRAELFSVDQLERHAKAMAGWHDIDQRPGPDRLLPRLAENEAILIQAYELVSAAVKKNRRIAPAAEWLLDNFYLIEEQIRTARRHLPKGYSRELPRLRGGPHAGYPRVYDIALELISHVDGRIDAESLSSFVASYQSISTLKLGELWAIPIMLRLALLENLRRVAARIAAGRQDRDRATVWAERMLEIADKEPRNLVLVLADMVRANPPLTSAFVAEFVRRLQGHSPALVFPLTWVEQRLAEHGQTLEQLVQQESQAQASDQVSIGNSIGSLRFLSAMDWREFVESMSAVERTLRTDPADIYSDMDFATRDRYRHAVEEIAKRSPSSEDEVAHKAVALARERSARTDGDARFSHVGYYLIDAGRRQLERAAAMRVSPIVLLERIAARLPLAIYMAGVLLPTAAVTAGGLWLAAKWGAPPWALVLLTIPLLLCASHLGVALVNWFASLLVRPRSLPRLDFSKGIRSDCRTIVAVPTILSSREGIEDLLESLEVRFLANRDENLHFALLTDFLDAPEETMPEDEELLRLAKDGVEALNRKYTADRDDIFFLFHRPRRWNEQEGAWMGWERKRGKLADFNACLRGRGQDRFSLIVGRTGILPRIRFVITLDSDTQLPPDAARQLVGTIAHPLNRPRFDSARGRVVEGYTILQPRVGVSLPSAGRSWFARLFAGEPGIDPYTRTVSDVYQDAFAEGSFIGKGIYDVDAFEQALAGRFPENLILSHDLLEGAHARAGLISDVLLFEDYPSRYTADVSRRHRWIRGDWQIAPWLLPRVPGSDARRLRNPISALSWWKIFDNLRRSLVPASLVLLFAFAWLLPGWPALFTLAVIGIIALPVLLRATAELLRNPDELPLGLHLSSAAAAAGQQVGQALFSLIVLPYDAYESLDAIIRTGTRMLITRRRLLEWQTSGDAERNARTDLVGFFLSMWIGPAVAAAVAAILLLARPDAFLVAAPILALWLISPAAAWWMSRPIEPARPDLRPDDYQFLQTLARRTWRFFEMFVGPADNHLPPDNFQEHPTPNIAHRTSPTNIGFAFLANLAANDFGYISGGQLIDRTSRTLATVEKMQRYRGHLYNWYDTRTLEPLPPLYVSTVDSGNLAGSLLVLARGLEELKDAPILPRRAFSGLLDTLRVVLQVARGETVRPPARRPPAVPADVLHRLERLQDELQIYPRTLAASQVLLHRLTMAALEFNVAIGSSPDDELKWWSHAFERHCRDLSDDLLALAPWIMLPPPTDLMWRRGSTEQVERLTDLRAVLRRLDDIPSLREVGGLYTTLLPTIDAILASLRRQPGTAAPEDEPWFARLRQSIAEGSDRAGQRLAEVDRLVAPLSELADMNYDFLYDKSRHLLAIGYNVTDHRLDPSYYDLLASEARICSYIAIAEGKLPQEHWFSLGRSLTTTDGETALLSWSGSMFEYLMPVLLMPSYENTLLDQTCRAVVRRQIEYGSQRGVPWGISESGYNTTDVHLNYQYRAFGVPGLGLKRGLADDLVVAPYAAVMALMVQPEAATENLYTLAEEGALGACGFYEAIDYTPGRLPRGQKSVPIKSFMAHHQGMSLLALAYLLLDRPMQRRFEADPLLRAIDLLLQERIPKAAPIYPHTAEVSGARMRTPAEAEGILRIFHTPHTSAPEVHLLSNGRYHAMVTAGGGGYSRFRDIALTRWREDTTRDAWGTFCYVRDLAAGSFWSIAHQPTLKPAESYEAVFSQARVEFRRRDGEIDTHTEISVSPEDDIELRRITLTNRGRTRRTIELTSYAEVILAPPAADAAHPAFSSLFVQTEIIRARQAILCTRRPRSSGERPPWMVHLMTVHGTMAGAPSYETDRSAFTGRARDLTNPAAMHLQELSNTEGAVLDPIVAIRCAVNIAPDEAARVDIVTGVADTREAAMALVEKYHDRRLADRVFELAWTHSQVVLRQLDATEADAQLYGRLAGSILYASPFRRAPGSIIARNRRGQSGLWGYGISGDLPIVLLRIGDLTKLDLVRSLVQAHAYWRMKGLAVDLVIWNEDQSGYRQQLHDQIMGLIAAGTEAHSIDRPGGIFVRRLEQISEEDKILMQTVARAIMSDSGGTLLEQMERRGRAETRPAKFIPTRPRRPELPIAVEIPRRDLTFFNGLGGFTPDGREYITTTTADTVTPAPWCNVIAGPHAGTVVTESGGGYTWVENAHEYRLTPWYNDPVSDATGEAFYIRDEETGRFWSPAPLPARGPMPCTTRHGFGYSVFEYVEAGISSQMWVYVAMDAPVKFVTIRIRNAAGSSRRLSITGYAEWVLGDHRHRNMMHVVTDTDPRTGALMARNSYNNEFPERVAFFDVSEVQRTATADRSEFIGRNGTLANPAAMSRARLSGRVGAGLDPCAAIQVMLDIADGQEREVTFILGAGRNEQHARELIHRYRGTGNARNTLEQVWHYWNRTLGTVYVETPDASLNYLVNGWLLYQVLSSRFWGRSGFYQSGGAFGFRDQLQDAMALIHAEPRLLREQLLRCAARQFKEGDVQHWWHPPAGRGVRTRFSDDYLWLPYAACRYIACVGDTGALDEQVPFLEGRPVQPEEESYYDLPARSEEKASLYEHCARAIRHGLRFGDHGLPLMGCGDWNDGMNLVGIQGRGESVWLAFFLYDILRQFADVASRSQDSAFAERCLAQATQLRENIEQSAWDGQWYRRAYFDNGEPLGSAASPECQIDSIPQSWAVLSGGGGPTRARTAMAAVDARLVRRDWKLIQLFDPPFDKSHLDPGYIKGYVPGVRENGGQYTHAAIWTAMAFATTGEARRAWECFNLINPVRHAATDQLVQTYKVEPYVVAADVYANPQHLGRGGWTWYTGSAAWMYRLITESLLGLRLEVDHLRFQPLLPESWKSFKIHYRYRETFHHITIHNGGGGKRVKRILFDGQERPDKRIPLIDDRQDHHAEIEIE